MTELDKLEAYLKEIGAKYERTDRDMKRDKRGRIVETSIHQIVVFKNGKRSWDAICHYGSYGNEQGLIEVYGSIVERSRDVVGWLTADEIIEALRKGARL